MSLNKTKLLMATRNKGKVTELLELLAGLPVEIMTLADFPQLSDIEEKGRTFRENAVDKAVKAAEHTGLMSLADDSGLEVEILDGQPGIYSARFAGEPTDDNRNNLKLLSLLHNVPPEKRQARFVSVIAIASPGEKGEIEIFSTEGSIQGLILNEFRGTGGFGYDPLFYIPSLGKTFAQLNLEEKNLISHRGQALRKAAMILRPLLQKGN